MATGRDLIRRSLVLIGVLAEGETPSASQLQDGLTTLSEMLSSWATEKLMIPVVTREEFSLTGGTASPTMGSSGTFDTTKPVMIESVAVKSGSTEIPVKIQNADEWAMVSDKTLQSTLPSEVYPSYGSPLVTLNFWPVPASTLTAVIYSIKPLTSITADAAINVQDGMMRAIRYNFAIELAAEYNRTVSAEVASIAASSKASIKRINSKPTTLAVDLALQPRRGFNILTGE